MRLRPLLAAVLIALLMFASADANVQILNGDDPDSVKTMTMEPFTSITLMGRLNAKVELGPAYTCRFSGSEDLVQHMEAKVENGTLKVREKPNMNFDFRHEDVAYAHITVPRIDEMVVAGVGDIDFSGKQDSPLKLVVAGAGNISAEGNVTTLSISITGTGDVRAEKLSAGATTIEITGTGNAEVANIIDSLDIKVAAAGKVEADFLKVQRLTVEVKAAGNISLTGTADTANIDVRASGIVRAAELIAKEAIIDVWGSGTVRLGVADSLKASIVGTGDVVYYGNPQVEKKVVGTGEIRQGS